QLALQHAGRAAGNGGDGTAELAIGAMAVGAGGGQQAGLRVTGGFAGHSTDRQQGHGTERQRSYNLWHTLAIPFRVNWQVLTVSQKVPRTQRTLQHGLLLSVIRRRPKMPVMTRPQRQGATNGHAVHWDISVYNPAPLANRGRERF